MAIVKYIKNGHVHSFATIGDKICTTIESGDKIVVYPTHDMMVDAGYELYVDDIQDNTQVSAYLPTIEELVEQKLRERYSLNQEFQVQRKRDTEKDAFDTYYAYVEECIAWAYAQPHREEGSI